MNPLTRLMFLLLTLLSALTAEECTPITLTIERQVISSTDDAEERSTGAMYLDSSDLELSEDGDDPQQVGIRFQSINIPQGATITKAYIQFEVDETSSESTSLVIKGENSDHSQAFSSTENNISNRKTTTHTLNWQPVSWEQKDERGEDQRTPDLSSIVQEIINRQGWQQGNAMSFIITGTGKRVAESYDGEIMASPILHIEYIGCEEETSRLTAMCYALTDNSDKLYRISMLPDGISLPYPTIINIPQAFNGEGSAYRASNNKFYAFKALSDNEGPSDLYTIDVNNGVTTKIAEALISGTVDGAEFYFNPHFNKEILYLISGENQSQLYAFDPDTWELLSGYPKTTYANLSSLAIDPLGGQAYAIDDYNYDQQQPKVYQLNLETGASTQITTLKNLADAEGLAFASDGNLYVEDEGRNDLEGKKLYQVNLETGELTAAAITNADGDIEGLSCNGTQLALERPSISIASNPSIVEGDQGIHALYFDIILNKPAPENITFTYRLNDIDATFGVDYFEGEPSSQTSITIPKESNHTSIMIPIQGDTTVENDEHFTLTLENIENAIFDEQSISTTGTIINDDEEEPDLIAEYRFDECPLTLTEEIEDHTPYRHRHRVRNGFTTNGEIAQLNRSGAFHRAQQQYTEGEDGLDEVFGTASETFTLTMWVYPTDLSDEKTNHDTANTIFAKASDTHNDNIEVGINSDGTLHLYLDTPTRDRSADFGEAGIITPQAWHFIGISYQSGEVTIQIDDHTYTDTTTWEGATTLSPAEGSPVTIGASLHVDNFFEGYIDELKIFRNHIRATVMSQFRERERNRRNWDDTIREEITCERALPVGCMMSAFLFQNEPTEVNILNLAKGERIQLQSSISLHNINAVGFNSKDGFFWGYNHTLHNGTLSRIGMNASGAWVSENFAIENLEEFDSDVGDINHKGELYLKAIGDDPRVVVIDLDPNHDTYLKKINELTLDATFTTSDWAFNPQDGLLYAVNNGAGNKYLYQIDPTNGTILSKSNTLMINDRTFSASFFDNNGLLYLHDSKSGEIFRIDVAHSAIPVHFSTTEITNQSDGAMCTEASFNFDFGDLPENYGSQLQEDGARHSFPPYGEPTLYLGSGVSHEVDALSSLQANLDALDDGVEYNNTSFQDAVLQAGNPAILTITTHDSGYLNAWIDWNGDGDFLDIGEEIAHNLSGASGEIQLTILPPSSGEDIVTYARFRYSSEQDLLPSGPAMDGEVEDYKLTIQGNQEPFVCGEDLYLSNRSELGNSEEDSGATWLHKILRPSFTYLPIGQGYVSDNRGYNAIGYNIQDNYIYALYGNHLLRIGSLGNVKDLGPIEGLSSEQRYAGEFDRAGYYYVTGQGGEDNQLYKIDINQKRVVATITLSQAVRFWDMAVDPTGNYFYAMLIDEHNGEYTNNTFAKIDINTGAITPIGSNHADIPYISLIFSDAQGKVVALAQEGGFYEISPKTGKLYSISPSQPLTFYNDGTSCVDANLSLPPHPPRLSINDVQQLEGDSGETIFHFSVTADQPFDRIPITGTLLFYKVIDGDGNEVVEPHGVALYDDHDFESKNGVSVGMDLLNSALQIDIPVPVYGDQKQEKDEEFYVEIYSPASFLSMLEPSFVIDKNRGIGLIINDDLSLRVERPSNQTGDLRSLYTQISGHDFDYALASYSGKEPFPLKDITLKVMLRDNQHNQELLSTSYLYFEEGSRLDYLDPNDLNISRASQDLSFQIAYLTDANGSLLHGRYDSESTYNAQRDNLNNSEHLIHEASDHFAIRPAYYQLTLGDLDEQNNTIIYRRSTDTMDEALNLGAEYAYHLEAQAVMEGNKSATPYYTTEEINASLIFEGNFLNCADTNDTLLKGYQFTSGTLKTQLSHHNVGEYRLHLEDDQWSKIDQNLSQLGCILHSHSNTPDASGRIGCNIASDTNEEHQDLKMTFQPYGFGFEKNSFENINGNGRDYLYMSDLEQSKAMGVELLSTIIAQGKAGSKLTNFTQGCMASPVKLALTFNVHNNQGNFNSSSPFKLYSLEGNEIPPQNLVEFNEENNTNLTPFNQVRIEEDKFLGKNQGAVAIRILYNLEKQFNDLVNPITVDFQYLDANSTNLTFKIQDQEHSPSGQLDIHQKKTYYFARVASYTEQYPETQKLEIETPLFVEIFCLDANRSWCDETMNMATIGRNINQKTDRGWYRAIEHDNLTDGKVYQLVSDNPLIEVRHPTPLPPFNNGRIDGISTYYVGDALTQDIKAQIAIDSDVWLRYNTRLVPNMPMGTATYGITIKSLSSTTGAGDAGNLMESVQHVEHNGKMSW